MEPPRYIVGYLDSCDEFTFKSHGDIIRVGADIPHEP